MAYLPIYLAKVVKWDSPFSILGRKAIGTDDSDFQKALGLPFLMHTLMMTVCVCCIIKIMYAVVRLQYLRVPQERMPVKNSIRMCLIGLMIVGMMPLIGDTVLGIIYSTVM